MRRPGHFRTSSRQQLAEPQYFPHCNCYNSGGDHWFPTCACISEAARANAAEIERACSSDTHETHGAAEHVEKRVGRIDSNPFFSSRGNYLHEEPCSSQSVLCSLNCARLPLPVALQLLPSHTGFRHRKSYQQASIAPHAQGRAARRAAGVAQCPRRGLSLLCPHPDDAARQLGP